MIMMRIHTNHFTLRVQDRTESGGNGGKKNDTEREDFPAIRDEDGFSQSFNGVNIAGQLTTSNLNFKDPGSFITLISTSSGKFIRVKVNTFGTPVGGTVKYVCSRTDIVSSSAGQPDVDDIVEFRWDNSAEAGTIQGTGITNTDTTINKIDIAYRTSSGLYAPNIDPNATIDPVLKFPLKYEKQDVSCSCNFICSPFLKTFAQHCKYMFFSGVKFILFK